MKFTEINTEGKTGLWANIHAKRARIKHGSGEKMRKPGSKGAPSAQNFKDAATEDANPKRQAAIAIAKKEQGVTENNQRGDTLVTDALKIMKGPEISDAILALKTVLGDREYNDRRGFYNFYVKQILDMYGQQGVNEFAQPGGDNNNNDPKSYLLQLADDLFQAIYVAKNKNAVKAVKDKIIDAGGNVKVVWNDDKSFNVVMYHPVHFKQGHLVSLVGDSGSKDVSEDWNKVNKKDKTSGMSRKAVKAYRRENPGSKLKTAVTTKPSKLKAGSKDAKRRKSFCARMGGNKGPMKKPNGKPTPKALALRRWNCESIEELEELVMLAEQYVRNLKK